MKISELGGGSTVLGIDPTWIVHQPSGVVQMQLGGAGKKRHKRSKP
jgi:hypothetical protein